MPSEVTVEWVYEDEPIPLASFFIGDSGEVTPTYFDEQFKSDCEAGIDDWSDPEKRKRLRPKDGIPFINAMERRYASSSTTVVSRRKKL